MLTIDLLRHGETMADAQKLYGASDVKLSARGQQQLTQAVAGIDMANITHITSSPLQRCLWLASAMTKQHKVSVEQGFSEMDFGDWEGQNTADLIRQGIDFRLDICQLAPPHGESFTNFSNRVLTTWQAYIMQHIQQGGHHLLISHGGVIRVILGLILNIPTQHLGKLYIPHAAWSRVTWVEGEPPVLWFMNREA